MTLNGISILVLVFLQATPLIDKENIPWIVGGVMALLFGIIVIIGLDRKYSRQRNPSSTDPGKIRLNQGDSIFASGPSCPWFELTTDKAPTKIYRLLLDFAIMNLRN